MKAERELLRFRKGLFRFVPADLTAYVIAEEGQLLSLTTLEIYLVVLVEFRQL